MTLTVERKEIALVAGAAIRVEATAASLVGPVSQDAGVPTGALVERGANANGEFTRWADGTLICWRTNLTVGNVATAAGALFRSSSNAGWTFPVAFVAGPAVSACCDNADCWVITAGAPSATAVLLRAFSAVSVGTAQTVRAMAVGRWF